MVHYSILNISRHLNPLLVCIVQLFLLPQRLFHRFLKVWPLNVRLQLAGRHLRQFADVDVPTFKDLVQLLVASRTLPRLGSLFRELCLQLLLLLL